MHLSYIKYTLAAIALFLGFPLMIILLINHDTTLTSNISRTTPPSSNEATTTRENSSTSSLFSNAFAEQVQQALPLQTLQQSLQSSLQKIADALPQKKAPTHHPYLSSLTLVENKEGGTLFLSSIFQREEFYKSDFGKSCISKTEENTPLYPSLFVLVSTDRHTYEKFYTPEQQGTTPTFDVSFSFPSQEKNSGVYVTGGCFQASTKNMQYFKDRIFVPVPEVLHSSAGERQYPLNNVITWKSPQVDIKTGAPLRAIPYSSFEQHIPYIQTEDTLRVSTQVDINRYFRDVKYKGIVLEEQAEKTITEKDAFQMEYAFYKNNTLVGTTRSPLRFDREDNKRYFSEYFLEFPAIYGPLPKGTYSIESTLYVITLDDSVLKETPLVQSKLTGIGIGDIIVLFAAGAMEDYAHGTFMDHWTDVAPMNTHERDSSGRTLARPYKDCRADKACLDEGLIGPHLFLAQELQNRDKETPRAVLLEPFTSIELLGKELKNDQSGLRKRIKSLQANGMLLHIQGYKQLVSTPMLKLVIELLSELQISSKLTVFGEQVDTWKEIPHIQNSITGLSLKFQEVDNALTIMGIKAREQTNSAEQDKIQIQYMQRLGTFFSHYFP